jgi:hypothetical protein
MMSKKEILEFVAKYDEDAVFGINEDGITLSELKHPNDFLELGGLPETYYDPVKEPVTCPHCNSRTDKECLTPKLELHECKHCEEKFYIHRD